MISRFRYVLIAFVTLLAAGCSPATNDPPHIWRINDRVSSPTVVGGTAYVSGDLGHLYALDLATNTLKWTWTSARQLPIQPAAIADDVVYAGSDDHNVYALDAASGREIWRFAAQASIISIPTVDPDQDTVYVAGGDAQLYALDRQTGLERWHIDLPGTMNGSQFGANNQHLSLRAGLLYLFTDDAGRNRVYAIDTQTHQTAWFHEEGGLLSSPTLGAGAVYVGTTGAVVALDAQTGAVRWRQENGAGFGTPLADGATVYVGGTTFYRQVTQPDGKVVDVYANDHGAGVYALDAGTGAIRWQYQSDSPVMAMPRLAGNRVYAVAVSDIYVVDAATGAPIKVYDDVLPRGPQAGGVGDTVLIGSDIGKLFRLDP